MRAMRATLATARISSAQWKRPRLYPKQRAAIFCRQRFAVIEASTKAGKTFGCIVWLLEQAWITGRPGRNYWWVAPSYSQAKIAFRRMKRGLTPGTFETNESDLTITLLNGAVIWCKTADNPDGLYGEDVYAAVVDEATRCKEPAWWAVRTTLTATRGPIRLIGNVKGRKNWVWTLARRAEAGAEDWHYARLTADDAVAGGVLDPREIEQARRDLPHAVFRELYYAEPNEGSNKFQRQWFEIVQEAPAPAWRTRVRYWDLAATLPKPGEDPDWTAGASVGWWDGIWYIFDMQHFQGTPLSVEQRIKQTAMTDGRGNFVYMEQEPGSSGVNTIDHYQRLVLSGWPFYGVRHTGSKDSRLNPLAAAAQAGNVKLLRGPWNVAFLDEAENYPADHDDQLDAAAGAMERISATMDTSARAGVGGNMGTGIQTGGQRRTAVR